MATIAMTRPTTFKLLACICAIYFAFAETPPIWAIVRFAHCALPLHLHDDEKDARKLYSSVPETWQHFDATT
jgi:hypothetical protein